MSPTYDAVVIGAGHNGLTAAALLARAGRRVVVVERHESPGGLAAGDEFHPGYRSAGLLHDTRGVRLQIVRALGLEAHGLSMRSRPAPVLAVSDAGEGLLLDGNVEATARGVGERSPRDAERYRSLREWLARVRGVVAGFLDSAPLNLVSPHSISPAEALRRGGALRRLGAATLADLLRSPPMSVADWLGEWFEDDLLKAALAWSAVEGGFAGPRSPGTAFNLLAHEAAAGPGVAGGGPALVRALVAAARESGVEIRTGADVVEISSGTDGVRGVVLASGERISAPLVAASCDPRRTFLELLPRGRLDLEFERRIGGIRTRGTTGQVLLAVSRPPRFAARPDEAPEFARIGCSLDRLERAFDPVKYGRVADRPVLDVHIPSIADPALAPPGHAVVSVLVHFVPYRLADGWSDARRERLGDVVVSLLDEHVPGLADSVLGRRVSTPVDLERRYALTGGQIHHGEHALDQRLVRPVPECIDYRTPLRGLFLCGSGSHPGGGLTCAPGALGARAMARFA